eukprot:GEMP01088816.1.p1 GENE.GEMP01088816.1~~GEMP01088816.1.p1  ORF type:complete len:126 (-),score=6.08 GEMP01088816.1:7-384(-)
MIMLIRGLLLRLFFPFQSQGHVCRPEEKGHVAVQHPELQGDDREVKRLNKGPYACGVYPQLPAGGPWFFDEGAKITNPFVERLCHYSPRTATQWRRGRTRSHLSMFSFEWVPPLIFARNFAIVVS